MPKEQAQVVFEALQELSHTDFTYLLGDLCAYRGWDPEVRLGDAETPGDLVVHQVLPLTESVALIYIDQGELTGDQVRKYIDRHNVDKLTIVVNNQPTEEAMTVASDNGIGLIGLGDIAKEIILLSATDVLLSYLPEDGAIATELEKDISNNPVPDTTSYTQQETEKEDSTDPNESTADSPSESDPNSGSSPFGNISEQTLDDSFTEDIVIGIKFTGAKYYETPDDLEDGYILSLEVASKGLATKYWGKRLSVQDTDGFTHEAMSKSDELKALKEADSLPSPWKIKDGWNWSASIPRSGKIKTLAIVPCVPGTRFSTWSYEHSTWAIEEDDDLIEETVPKNEFKLKGTFEDWDVLLDSGLPDEVEKGLTSLGYQAVDTEDIN